MFQSPRRHNSRTQSPRQSHRAFLEALEQRTLLSGNGLAAAYFDNTDLTNVKLARTDSQIGFDWSSGAPTSAVGSDFSVRWTGRVQARFTEQYRFIALTAGSVRLWVNGNLIIDDWTDHASKVDSGYINLVAGKRYDIRMEFASGANPAGARLYYQSASQPKTTIPRSEFYSSPVESIAPASPVNLKSSYLTDTTIKIVWNPVADASGPVVYDIYSGKTKLATTSGTSYTRAGRTPATAYSFSVRAVDEFGNASAFTNAMITTAAPALSAGGTGLGAKYYSGDAFNHFWLTRTDSTVNFNWPSSPVQSSDGSFSVVWSGKIIPRYSETYTFYANTDDGDRLIVNNQVLFDHWNNPSGSEDSGTITLTAGKQYAISLQYQNVSGAGNAALSWSSLSQLKQIVPASQLLPSFVDSTAPAAPTGLRVLSVSTTTVALSWNAATDDVGVAAYDVYRGSTKIGQTIGLGFTDQSLTAGTPYQYHVIALDGASHSSISSSIVSATTTAGAAHDALSQINATSFDASSGVTNFITSVGNIDTGDWIEYANTNFHSGVASVQMQIALPTGREWGQIVFHLDSPTGTVVGTLVTQPTGSDYTTFLTQQTEISGAAGTHDLYLVGANQTSIGNIKSFQFSTNHLVKIMAIGDSITQEFPGQVGWRYDLYHALEDEGKNVDFVGSQIVAIQGYSPNLDFDQDNEGHSGFRTDQILASMPTWAQVDPDIALIHLGTNDIRQGISVNTAIANIGLIIDDLRAVNPNVKIVLAEIIPADGQPAVDDFNALVPGLASQKSTGQSPIVVCDQHTGFDLATDSDDGLHPNSVGDEKMTANWLASLQQFL